MQVIVDRKAVTGLVFVLFLACILQMGSFVVSGSKGTSGSNTAMDSPTPVVIQSDNDFMAQGWPGNGSSVNPFVIEGLYFQSTQRPYINISNVKSNFVIRNCSFVIEYLSEGYSISVSLLNVSQFLIANSTFDQGWVDIRNSTNCVFRGDNLTSHDVPIHAWFCNHIELTDNHIVYSNQFILIYECQSLTARGNELVGDGYVYGNVRDAFEFTSNRVLGDLSLSLGAAFMNISWNTFSMALATSVFYILEAYARTMVMSHNNFSTGGIVFNRWDSPYVSDTLDVSDNYIAGRLIPFLKELHSQTVDCSSYPEVIAYDCTDVIFSGGDFQYVGAGIAVLSCTNATVVGTSSFACGTGVFVQECDNCTVKDSTISECGICLVHCNATAIVNCDISNGLCGIYLTGEYNTTIAGNRIAGNQYGIMIEFSSGLLVYGNVFEGNRQSVFYSHYYASPSDRWDNGNGTGNTWSDYFGIGPYVLSAAYGWTIADHYPKSTLAWYATPIVSMVVMFLAVLLGVALCVTLAYVVSKRRKGTFAKVLGSRNNWLLVVSLVWLLVPPFVVMIEFSDYIGTTIVLSSMTYSIWYDLGWVYASPTFFTLSWYNVYSFAFLLQILCIILLFVLIGIAWNDKKRGQHRRLTANPILWTAVVYVFFALFLRGSPYGGWFNPAGVPIPISPILVFLSLRHVVREEPHPMKDEFRLTAATAMRCPHCGASYVYPRDRLATDGTVECQNCAKRFQSGGRPESHRS